MYPRNAANPPAISATVVRRSDGTPITSGVSARYDCSGTQVPGSGLLWHAGNGQWRYKPTQAETDVPAFAVQFYHPDAVGTGPTVSVITTVIPEDIANILKVVQSGP